MRIIYTVCGIVFIVFAISFFGADKKTESVRVAEKSAIFPKKESDISLTFDVDHKIHSKILSEDLQKELAESVPKQIVEIIPGIAIHDLLDCRSFIEVNNKKTCFPYSSESKEYVYVYEIEKNVEAKIFEVDTTILQIEHKK